MLELRLYREWDASEERRRWQGRDTANGQVSIERQASRAEDSMIEAQCLLTEFVKSASELLSTEAHRCRRGMGFGKVLQEED
jgi:hypothetical protein